MSTVVCQGFLDSHLVETTTMRLKLVSPKSLELPMDDINHNNDSFGGKWDFQPLDYYKQSSILKLSGRSLELCTESLGSESGSDTSESSILSLSLSTSTKSSPRKERNFNSIPSIESRKSTPRSFPPPLTTISGSNSLQVKPHREGGRLIIQAMEAPSTLSYFQTERSKGRLRLSFWENIDYNFNSNVSSSEECEEEEEEEEIDYDEDDVVYVENDMINDEKLEKVLSYEVKEEGIDYDDYVKKIRDMDGNNHNVDMGMEKFQRAARTRSRCKEDGHGDKGLMCKWEAFWVATT